MISSCDGGVQADSKLHTESIYSGGLDKDGMPYVSRTYWVRSLAVCILVLTRAPQ